MNTSTANLTRKEFSLTTAAVTIELIVFFIIFFLGVVGNIVLVMTVYKRQALHRVTYYLVSALAIEDFLALITHAVFLPQAFVLGDWILGDLGCSIYSFLIILCGFSEIYLIAVISLDRYIACCKPLRYSDIVTPRRCAGVIVLCWVFAFALTLFLIAECKFYDSDEYLKNCLIESSHTPKIQLCLFTACCLATVPCSTTVSVCQWKILKQVRRVMQNLPPNVTSDAGGIANRPSKATITVSLITGTFFICWFPLVTVNSSVFFIDWKQSASLHETQYILKRITLPIFLVSKFANPIIYGIYNREFCTECRQLFACLN